MVKNEVSDDDCRIWTNIFKGMPEILLVQISTTMLEGGPLKTIRSEIAKR